MFGANDRNCTAKYWDEGPGCANYSLMSWELDVLVEASLLTVAQSCVIAAAQFR